VQGATIERNLFETNNLTPAVAYGLGIASIGTSTPTLAPVAGLVITENEFIGNMGAAILTNYTEGATITKNTSENDASFVVFFNSSSSQFSHNRGKNFGHAGVVPTWPVDAAVEVGPGNEALEISYNELENGKAPIKNGIAFTTAFGPGYSHLLNVIGNKITRFPEDGIVAEDLPSAGTLYDSSIIDNEVYDNGVDGIFIAGLPLLNYGIDLFDNDAEDNANKDCEDDTGPSGPGTLGTWNVWFNNTGGTSSPPNLCSPGNGHEHD
jgi:hypothetical protein